MTNIAIFASGSGTNAQNLMSFFRTTNVNITKVYCNKEGAEVLERAKNFNTPTRVFSREEFYNTDNILKDLQQSNVDYIILAGFLWFIPDNLTRNYPQRMINIHPSLLPKYGGKGMFGMNVHNAVVENKETETGITIHLVDEVFDNGKVIFQARCWLDEDDTPEVVADKVHTLEYEHYPPVIMAYITQNKDVL